MNGNEKMLVDSLVNISKSLARIADDISALKEVVSRERRESLLEMRRQRAETAGRLVVENANKPPQGIAEGIQPPTTQKHSPTTTDMLDKIRAIRDGAYIF